MNSQEAKQRLALYRPGTADASDESFAEALACCDRDPQLKGWFDEHCTVYLSLRSKFKAIRVPEGFKEQILAERKVATQPMWRRHPSALLACTALAVVLITAGFLFLNREPPPAYPLYAEVMTEYALRGYPMESTSSDLGQIRSFLSQNGAPSDFQLRSPMEKIKLTGCGIQMWQGSKVSLICFQSGDPLRPGATSDLWLFVADRASLRNPPASSVPVVSQINRATTASWTSGGRVYLLVTEGDSSVIRKFL